MKNLRIPAVALCAAAGLAGCWGDDDGGPGKLSLAVTDAPVDDASAVVVQFTGVEVKPASGAARSFDYDTPRSIDLLALNDGTSEVLLDQVEVPSGRYEWVRLKVDANEDGVFDSYIALESDGAQHELVVPSGDQSGLKLNRGFVVPAGGAASFTIDFDLRKSVHEPMNESPAYVLRPTLRIVDNAVVGAIAGTVASGLVGTGCVPAVYVFSGVGVTPDDVDGTAPEPVTTALVSVNDSGAYAYRAAFLSPGTYTVAFTCDADDDQPATSETLAFSPTQTATVVTDQTTTVNFTATP